ncbi:MAG TPA: hypothetical protein VI029_03070 [Mycobacterium sp.]
MADGRRRSTAKQARRDARRRKARRREPVELETPEETPLIDEVRQALDGGRPLDLLDLLSLMMLATAPQQPTLRPQPDAPGLDELVTAFIGVQVPETTALLTVLGELIVDDDVLRARCRHEVDVRKDSLPRWLVGLAQTTVHRVVRMSHVLGDGDELLLGVRLADGQEMTCAVHIDHLMMSAVKDAFFVPESVDAVVSVAKASNADPDASFVDLGLAEARAVLQYALEQPFSKVVLEASDTWPACRALVRWLTRLMPIDSSITVVPQHDSSCTAASMKRFFASSAGAPFDDHYYREMLERCIEEGTGDPLRWSEARLSQLLSTAVYADSLPMAVQLDVPELLLAFVPFAHAESGIRQALTAEALTAIDALADHYRSKVVEDARYNGYFDDDEGPVE